jgi:hypothetical protein
MRNGQGDGITGPDPRIAVYVLGSLPVVQRRESGAWYVLLNSYISTKHRNGCKQNTHKEVYNKDRSILSGYLQKLRACTDYLICVFEGSKRQLYNA